MRRRAEQAEREAQQLRDAEAERQRKKAEDEGRWKDLAEQEKKRADDLAAQIAADERRRNVERAASERQFADTGYALYLLEQQNVDMADAAKVAEALDQLKESRPDLLSTPPQPPPPTPPPPSGGPPGAPAPPANGFTAEQIKAMPAIEVQKLMATAEGAAAVNAALAAP
jgi:hypothetical protein